MVQPFTVNNITIDGNLAVNSDGAGNYGVITATTVNATNVNSTSTTSLSPSGDTTGAADTTAIQAALNAATAGATVKLAPGTFYLNAPLNIPSWVSLEGSGCLVNNSLIADNVSTLSITSGFTSGFTFSGAVVFNNGTGTANGGQALRKFNIDGTNAPASVDGITSYGEVYGVIIEDVSVYKATGIGLNMLLDASFRPADGWRINGLMLSQATSHGFFTNGPADMVINDMHVIGCGGDGARIEAMPNSVMSNCRFANNTLNGLTFGVLGTAGPGGSIQLVNTHTEVNGHHGTEINWTVHGGNNLLIDSLTSLADGFNGGTGGSTYAGFTVTNAVTPIVVNGLYVITSGSVANCPNYGVSVTNCSYLTINSGTVMGGAAVFNNGGGNGTITIAPEVLTGTGENGSPTFNTLSAQTAPPAMPSDHGLLAWNYDPVAAANATIMVSKSLYLSAIYVRSPMLATNIWLAMTSGAGTITTTGIGLFNSAGTLLSSNTTTTNFATGGLQFFVLGTPQTLTPGLYWVGVFNQATTPATLRNANVGIAGSVGITNASLYRFAVNGTNVTSLASITPASNTQTSLISFWCGIS